MQAQRSLLEQENERLTTEVISVQNLNENLTTSNGDLESEIENVSSVNKTLQNEKSDLQSQVFQADSENQRLRQELKGRRRETVNLRAKYAANQQAAADGITALAYFKNRYVSRYESYHDKDDLPMTEREKLTLRENVGIMTLDDLIISDQNLSTDVRIHGLRMKTKASGLPEGYTGNAV